MRKVLGIFLAIMLLLSWNVADAAERQPVRIAQVPLIVSSGCWQVPGQPVQDDLERQIDRALHVPLNGVLNAVTYLPEDDSEKAMDDAYAALGERARLKDVVRHMGEQMNADLVVVPVLTSYEQFVRHSWHWDRGLILHSYAALSLGVYDRRTDEAFVKQASRLYEDDYSTAGSVENLARKCTDEVVREADLRGRLAEARDAGAGK